MDSSFEENLSNDSSDWEMLNEAKERLGTPMSCKKKVAKGRKIVAKSAEKSDMKVKTVDSEKVSRPSIVEKKIFVCSFCEKTFTIQRHLKNHCKKEHDIEVDCEVKAPVEIENKSYCCNLCKCSYTCVSSLKEHQKTKHGVKFEAAENLFTCNICFLKYATSHYLELHQADKHGTVVKPGAIQDDLNKSEKKTQKYRIYQIHKKHHSDDEETKHVCEICGTAFTKVDSLMSHYKLIHPRAKKHRITPHSTSAAEKSFVCDICGWGFLRQHQLKEHFFLKHSKEPLSHKCEYCEKSYNRPVLLEYHVNKEHLKKKPYTCDSCKKEFFSKQSLKKHKYICNMTSENMICCEHCGKLFTSRQNCRFHIQAVHSKPALVCGCGKVVRWESSVVKHKRRCSLFNAKLKTKNKPVEYEEDKLEDANDRLVAEKAAVAFLQNQYGDTYEVNTEVNQEVEGNITAVVSEESEVAESGENSLEAIPSGSLEGSEDKHEMPVVEEHIVDGGETVTSDNVTLVTQDGQNSSKKIYYIVQYR